MLDQLQHSLRIGLSRTGITLLKTSGLLRRQTSLLANAALSEEASAVPERLGAQLHNMLVAANCTKLPTTIILSDDWVRLLMVAPPRNAGSLQDCRAAAEMRFLALYGDSTAGWQLEADWDARHAFLACALPRPLLEVLQQTALKNGSTLISIAPQFIAMWNHWHRKLQADAWFGVVQGDMLTLGAIDQQRLCAVRPVAVPDGAWGDKQWLPEHLTREALRLNLPAPSCIQLCGALPDQWATRTMDALTCIRLDAGQSLTEPGSITAGGRLAGSGMRS
jgi:hypothetical protein